MGQTPGQTEADNLHWFALNYRTAIHPTAEWAALEAFHKRKIEEAVLQERERIVRGCLEILHEVDPAEDEESAVHYEAAMRCMGLVGGEEFWREVERADYAAAIRQS